MGSSLKAGSVWDRVSGSSPAAPLAVTAAIVVLALAGGAQSGEALGLSVAGAWLLVLAAVLVHPDRLRSLPPALSLAAALLLVLLALTALSLGWGSDDGAGFEEVVRQAGFLGAFVLAGLLAAPGRGRGILIGILGGALAVALVALASRLLGIGAGDAALAELLPPSSGRLSYPIGYWNGLGAVVVLGIPVLLHLAAEERRPLRCGLLLAAFSPLLLTAYMTSSRGALLAALVGSGVAIAFSGSRRRSLAVLVAAVLLALPAMVGATLAGGILETPGGGAPGGAELAVLALLLGGVGVAALLGARLVAAGEGQLRRASGLPRVRPAIAIPVLVALVAGVVLLTGPGRFVDDFSSLSPEARTESGSGILSASGSGRAQFWGTALDAFADDPLRGIGAGGYGTYWSRFGALGTPTRNAHSEPLELLAELGIGGLILFLAFVAVVLMAGLGRARASGGALAGAAVGVLAAGAVGILIDWTWQIPAVSVPLLIVAAALAAGSFGPAPLRGRIVSAFRVPAPLAGAGLVVVAVGAVWAGGVLAAGSARLAESERALADGDPAAAAAAARAAIAIQPWSAEPWLQLAEVERTVDNVEASGRAARRAIELAPYDFRPWILVAGAAGQEGNLAAGTNYAVRVYALAPRILLRLEEFTSDGSPAD